MVDAMVVVGVRSRWGVSVWFGYHTLALSVPTRSEGVCVRHYWRTDQLVLEAVSGPEERRGTLADTAATTVYLMPFSPAMGRVSSPGQRSVRSCFIRRPEQSIRAVDKRLSRPAYTRSDEHTDCPRTRRNERTTRGGADGAGRR